MWQHPEDATLAALREIYLQTEGDLEDARVFDRRANWQTNGC